MKKITINGEQWWYKITSYRYGEYNAYIQPQTSFYITPFVIKRQKKFWLFGPIITSEVENDVPYFSIGLDITNPTHDKATIKTAIDNELAILDRIKEIENGEII